VGRFRVEFEVANYADLIRAQDGTIPLDRVRRETIRGMVDSGATKLVLPLAVVERLGLPLGNPVRVRYADGRRARRREAKDVFVQLLGREGVFTAVSEPKRDTALIGAIILEALDLLVDSRHRRLLPRDPTGVIAEFE
jgi:predicted aspartyl protease